MAGSGHSNIKQDIKQGWVRHFKTHMDACETMKHEPDYLGYGPMLTKKVLRNPNLGIKTVHISWNGLSVWKNHVDACEAVAFEYDSLDLVGEATEAWGFAKCKCT